MLIKTLQHLEQLQAMDSSLIGSRLGSFRQHLDARGWIKSIGYLSHVDVECWEDDVAEVEVEIDEAAGRYRFPSPECPRVILSRSLTDITRYRFQLETFFDHLAKQLGIEPRIQSRRRCLVPDHLWYLGDLRVGGCHAFAPMFFGRLLRRAAPERITAALADPTFLSGGVVMALADPKLSLPNGHQLRTVAELLITEGGVDCFDLEMLDRILGGQHQLTLPAEVVVACAPDGSWLRVGDRELRKIRGQQQDFVLTMVEAYYKGNRRPKIEWAFRVAGYGEGTYDLRHISRRPEFLGFFAQEGGECWIVTNPFVESSQVGKV